MKPSCVRLGVFFFLNIVINNARGQQYDRLSIDIDKVEASIDSCCIYNISFRNNCDSILCILHSMFLDLTSTRSQGLALYDKTKGKEIFSLDYCLRDTIYNVESQAYRGECLLPYQSISFKIFIPKGNNRVEDLFNFKFIYLEDICYRKFTHEMKKMTAWYRKYKILEKTIELPK